MSILDPDANNAEATGNSLLKDAKKEDKALSATDVNEESLRRMQSRAPSDDMEAILAKTNAKDLQDNDKAGFLQKRSMYKHAWKSRYLVLKGNRLFSSKKINEKPTGAMLIDVNTMISQPQDGEAEKTLSERSHSFQIKDSSGLVWPLAAESDKDRDEWLSAIQTVIDDARLLALYKGTLMLTVQTGATFIKFNFDKLGALSKKNNQRFVNVSTDCKQLMWHKPGAGDYNDMNIADITKVVAGAETEAFQNVKKGLEPEKCFSVISTQRTLDLVASSKAERDTWVKGLTAVVKFGSVLTDDVLEELEDNKAKQVAQAHAKLAVENRKKDRSKLKNLIDKTNKH